MKNIIFIAPPAAGKGTMSLMLKEKYGYEHISTGDLIRAEIKAGNKELEDILSKGNLVSDEIIFAMLKKRLSNIKTAFILDGFPRTINQCYLYSDLCKDLGIDIGKVIYLKIDKQIAMKRALGRLTCKSCKKGYNKFFAEMMPKVEGICDNCGGELEFRSDDNEEAFNHRFDVYLKEVEDILAYYEKLNLLNVVDVQDKPEDTFALVEKVIND
ncbi:MAG TPA: nucleoside monophosphate kinase [Bacilli bacterium]|nr:nucleoside monophosphate kinase [Bacilli bacterium]